REAAPDHSTTRYTPAAQRNPQVRLQNPAGVLVGVFTAGAELRIQHDLLAVSGRLERGWRLRLHSVLLKQLRIAKKLD
ncbi:hypothetical protein ACFU6R_21690, partial [Streptomyces sp. NPDC057499]|uniref:hypothetical protein n=1 Tax=Streptomyces sp. NPDC057499 TaxID=3346150 RepID=UPI00367F9F36